MNKRTLKHYIAQFTGVFLVQIPIALRWMSNQPDRVNFIFKSQFCDTLTNLIINIIYIHIFNFLLRKKYGIALIILAALLLIAVSPSFFFVLTNLLKWLFWDFEFELLNWLIIDKATASYFVGYSFYILIYFVTHYWLEYKDQKEKTLKATSLANEAQLQMLQYQINPHFLFNSLNSIQSMIEKDKDRAKEMIADLSDFFRHTLSGKNQVFISLQEEINALDKYLSIQKERFQERLNVSFYIDKNSPDKKIPAFLIHPLVENSIKYGFSVDNDVLNLIVATKISEDDLTIVVKNSGKLMQADLSSDNNTSSTKTGIENIKKRLALLYPGKHEFRLFEKDNWVTAKIVIRGIE